MITKVLWYRDIKRVRKAFFSGSWVKFCGLIATQAQICRAAVLVMSTSNALEHEFGLGFRLSRITDLGFEG